MLHVGKGIPNQRALTSRVAQIDESIFPTTTDAISSFHTTGGRLSTSSTFGQDPLGGHTLLQQRRTDAFTARFPAFEVIFHETVNGDGSLLKAAVMHFIQITKSLPDQI